MKVEMIGVRNLELYFQQFPRLSDASARLAANGAARFGSRQGSRAIRSQVAFSRSYIGAAGSSQAKLRIKKFARVGDVEAIIAARDRPTSLARFAVGTPSFGPRPKFGRAPRVKVKAGGKNEVVKRGFYVKLRRGAVVSDDAFNLGLAIRLKKGETLQATAKASPLGGGAYLLYGPSVAQVWDTVREDISGDVGDFAAAEFFRQFGRMSRG